MRIGILGLCINLAVVLIGRADDSVGRPPHFLGAQSCSSSYCHGGAGENRNQYLAWNKLDFHSRSYATLTTARSARFAEVLNLKSALTAERCTVCHAPIAEIPETRRAGGSVTDGVSCENCHGHAEPWIRSHTRTDLSHADRVACGLRDLKDLYVRANTCVACHQNLNGEILAAGHPELIFELDGQSASEPRHWREARDHGQIWLEGQVVALREMSWQLSIAEKPEQTLAARWSALLWLLEKISKLDPGWPDLSGITLVASREAAERAQKMSDELAKEISQKTWEPQLNAALVKSLAKTAADFRDTTVRPEIRARRAERLVLALDRLNLATVNDATKSNSKEIDAAIDQLFKLAQNILEFDSLKFAAALKALEASIPGR